MTEPVSLGSCHACGYKLSAPRLKALLRRRALERLLRVGTRQTKQQLAEALTAAGFRATWFTVKKDLLLLNAVRIAEARWTIRSSNPKES